MARIGGPRRAMIAMAGLGVTVLVLVVSRVVTAPVWVPAISGVPLEQSSELSERLGEAGIEFKLDRGGSDILVAQDDLARARVALAKGGLASGARPGLEIFDRQTWGWNDFTQRVNYRRALEGELERTIGNMRGIDRAEVHIAIPEQSAFRRASDRPSTASVLLALTGGQPPHADVIRGIAQLVSSSVDGLAVDRVSIHDETGRLWSEDNDGSVAALTGRQLRVQQEIERYLEGKADAILSEFVGPGNARVRVTAAVNFDRLERTTQSVDPGRQALASEQKAEIVPGAQGGAGSLNIATTYENTRSTEVYAGAIGGVRRLAVAVLVNARRLPPSGPNDTVPRFADRSPAELASIDALVRSAIGADSARGDIVTVVSQSFAVAPVIARIEKDAPVSMAAQIREWQRPALSALGILAVVIVGFITLRALGAPPAAVAGAPNLLPAHVSAHASAHATAPVAAPVVVPAPRPEPQITFTQANTQVRDKVVATVQENPDTAVRLVKAWIKEG